MQLLFDVARLLRLLAMTLTVVTGLITALPPYRSPLQGPITLACAVLVFGLWRLIQPLRDLEAKFGSPWEKYNRGVAYYRGWGAPKDDAKAIRWFDEAIRGDYPPAMFAMAVMVEQGEGLPRNPEAAFEWYQRSANDGFGPAMLHLGSFYERGDVVAKNPERAVSWYRKAAEQGWPEAMVTLGIKNEDGSGTAVDYQAAREWFQKAADRGYGDAYYHLGVLDEFGKGVPRDLGQAVAHYARAAKAGSLDGMIALAYKLHHGLGVRKNRAKAVRCLKKATEQGSKFAPYYLGAIDQQTGKSRDLRNALHWYRLAAERGFIDALALAGRIEALLLKQGHAGLRPLETSREAADQGSSIGMYDLGVSYLNGTYTEKDDAKALYWFRKSARLGLSSAQNSLGYLYAEGIGVPRNALAARRLFETAAQANDATAQFNLGELYEKGWGVEKSLVKAMTWYMVGADHGSVEARQAVERLSQAMDSGQRNEARRLAAAWQDEHPVNRAIWPPYPLNR